MRTRWKLLGGTGVASIWAVAIIIGQSGVVQGDTSDTSSTTSITEPLTETPIQPLAGSEPAVAKDPFAPYGVGPAEEVVPYEGLSPEEQTVADRGLDAAEWHKTHNAYGAAIVERSKRAKAEAAQHQLGIDSLETMGVVQ